MRNGQAWDAVVVAQSRALLDGSNPYRRLTVRHDDGREETVRVPREGWQQCASGDRVVHEAGRALRRA